MAGQLLHTQVYRYLLRLFDGGSIHPGDTLPGELELAERLKVSRNTVRHALADLEREGRIERRKRRGTIYLGDVRRERDGGPAKPVVGVINNAFFNSIYPELNEGIDDRLHREGLSMLLSNGTYDSRREIESIDRMLAQGVPGLIVEPYPSSPAHRSADLSRRLRSLPVPLVTTNCVLPELDSSSVTVDDEWVGHRATHYLIEAGHTRIACVFESASQPGVLRMQGYRRALAEAGLPYRADLVVGTIHSRTEKHPAAAPTGALLLDTAHRPTAIFFFNDEFALQGLKVMQEHGIEVPRDISVIGVDNIPEAGRTVPGLTTFDHPKYVMGAIAAELLIDRMGRGRGLPGQEIRLRPGLIERTSVSTPSAG